MALGFFRVKAKSLLHFHFIHLVLQTVNDYSPWKHVKFKYSWQFENCWKPALFECATHGSLTKTCHCWTFRSPNLYFPTLLISPASHLHVANQREKPKNSSPRTVLPNRWVFLWTKPKLLCHWVSCSYSKFRGSSWVGGKWQRGKALQQPHLKASPWSPPAPLCCREFPGALTGPPASLGFHQQWYLPPEVKIQVFRLQSKDSLYPLWGKLSPQELLFLAVCRFGIYIWFGLSLCNHWEFSCFWTMNFWMM